MRTLIAYGTTEGQTRKIANHVAAAARKVGHEVGVHNCADDIAELDVPRFDAVMVAASVHQQRYQSSVYRFIGANLKALRTIPSAFISVSLSNTFTAGQEEAQRYCDVLSDETGWRADMIHLAEGAVRYSEYDFFKVQTIEHVVLKGQREMPPKNGNPEFTDWDALDEFVSEFAAHAEKTNQADAAF